MTEIYLFQIACYLFFLLIFVKPLGWYMAQVYEGKSCGLNRLFSPLEKFIYRFCNIAHHQEMEWKTYLSAMLIFNLLGLFAVYIIQRLQSYFPFNPQLFSSISPNIALNTAASFVTNTDWQAYSGENTLSYFTQMHALTVQNFLSAATGMSILVAFIRGLTRRQHKTLGNFWVDVVRSVLYILLPLSLLFAVILTSQGVIQNFKPYQKIDLLQPFTYQSFTNTIKATVDQQIIPMGPVASQIAIKQLGTNGGGFFNANSAHPFENPNPITNFLEMLAILLIPAAFCYTFGVMVKDTRQGWAILFAMFIIFVPLIVATTTAEQQSNPLFLKMPIDQTSSIFSPSGNMEGKEMRFGIASSTLWTTAAMASGNGAVNAMLDSFTPLGGLVPLWLMHLGEVVFGGVGSGLYGMLMLVIITVFVAGLMVGRTPEYLGKKIEAYEMKMATVAVLIMPLIVLIFTALAAITPMGIQATGNPGVHGFTEILYAFTSMTNNNGSAFSGLDASQPFYTLAGSMAMLIGRYWAAIPVLAMAGSLVQKKQIPTSSGTLPTHTLLFIVLLVSVIVVLGALTFFPALALGPIVEHLMLWQS